ncbi:helix-turn-helix transcriptional regulator [Mammaliicoccus sp. I-M35]|uniref:helix-turn-helix domain-containing protein n=1 Tax=Mammaliicoccus sp. I-M35 TaxID=2898694 RepID=UPI001EFA2B3A|nr:helix-turn-helix transcriptional regulator [Mammaliicoccus sp. I-M35]
MIFCTLKKLMKEYGVNQTQIIENTGITRPTLIQLIENQNNGIKYNTVEKLCDYFDIKMEQLLIHSKINIEYVETNIFEDTSLAIQTDGELAKFTVISSFLIDSHKFDFENDIIVNNLDITETYNIYGNKNLELTCFLDINKPLSSKVEQFLLKEKDIFELYIYVFDIETKILNSLPFTIFETVSLNSEIIKDVENHSIESVKVFIDSLTKEDKTVIFNKLNEELNQSIEKED